MLWRFLSQSYKAILPSSFSVIITNTLEYHSNPPVSVLVRSLISLDLSWKKIKNKFNFLLSKKKESKY